VFRICVKRERGGVCFVFGVEVVFL